jgi:hypothetical protein
VTDDKLYSVVKTGVRQNEYLTTSQVLFGILTRAAGRSRAEIARMLGGFSAFLLGNRVTVGLVVGGEVLIAIGVSDQDVVAECRRLEALPGTSLSAAGDKVVYDNRSALFRSADDEDYLLFGNVGEPNPAIQALDMSYLKVLAALVKAGASIPQRSAV